MTVRELLDALRSSPDAKLHLMLPGGEFVPSHFHVTEIGRVQKDFIDCGGTSRSTVSCLLQAWVANDTEHRLTAGKLAGIVLLAAPLLGSESLPVEVEYEDKAVSQYPLAAVEATPSGLLFHLGVKHTDCLAKDRCGIPVAGATECAGPACC